MLNHLPAIVIGGPAHAGKSVLFHTLTQMLRHLNVPHHAIRACPDGEGNWSQESDEETVSIIRVKGQWSDEFVERVCLDLEHRRLPMLVDIGGHPTQTQTRILDQCTHSILLMREDKPDETQRWQRLLEEHDVLPLAQLVSALEGSSTLTAQTPTIQGTVTGLLRNAPSAGSPVLTALVQRIVTLFRTYSSQELEELFFEQAPAEVMNLNVVLLTIDALAIEWKPSMLVPLLAYLPAQAALSAYGVAPHWVYGALAAYVYPKPFYQFDPRTPIGWIQPLALTTGNEYSPELSLSLRSHSDDAVLLTTHIRKKHLNYFQPEPLVFPTVPPAKGIIINGALPSWLVTGIVRLYWGQNVPWLACYQPQLQGAVVVASRVANRLIGEVIPLPLLQS